MGGEEKMKISASASCRIALFLAWLSFSSAGCFNSVGSLPEFKYTTADVNEAKVIALCLSGALTPPDGLANQVLENLAEIRSHWGGIFPSLLTIRFRDRWRPSCTIVGFDEATAQLVANGQYTAWDALNEQFQVEKIDMRLLKNLESVVLTFKEWSHPYRLSESYRELPGVRYAHPNFTIGDGPTVYPSAQAQTFLFRNAWGDCPSGCIMSEYWYFVSNAAGSPSFIGYWDPWKDPQVPDWWPEARSNIVLYRTF